MKRFYWLLAFIVLTGLATPSFAQNQRVTLKGGTSTLAAVFAEIESQTDLSVDYDVQVVDGSKTVSVPAASLTVKSLLDRVLQNTGYTYTVNRNHIIVTVRQVQAKDRANVLKGRVLDGSGQPVIGAGVLVSGTSKGTVTDASGSFELDAPEGSMLTISALGYESRSVVSDGRSDLSIVLEESNLMLEETIVIGYGSKNRNKIVGAVNQVSQETFAGKPVTNAGQALQGAIPNLNITLTDGRLNRNPTYNVRGYTSITGGSPLVLVDGVPGDINLVAPEDIERVSVLKDASSAAIYGAQASFGVILVTTKSGNDEKPHFRYTANVGVSQPLKTPELLTDGIQYATIMQEAYTGWAGSGLAALDEVKAYLESYQQNPDLPIAYVNDMYLSYISGQMTDWYKTIYNDSQMFQRHHLELSGKSGRVRYYISGGISSQDGVYRIATDNLQLYSLKAKADVQVTGNFRLYNNFSIEDKKYSAPNTTVYGNWDILRFMTQLCAPFSTIYDNNGNYTYGGLVSVGLLKDSGRSTTEKTDIRDTFGAELSLFGEALKLKGDFSIWEDRNFGCDQRIRLSYSSSPGNVAPMSSMPDYIKKAYTEGKMYTVNAYADFNKTLGRHTLGAIVGFNQVSDYYRAFDARVDDNLIDGYSSLNLANGDKIITDGESSYATRGIFYRLSYDFDSRYLVELNGRYDGTSKFPAGRRWGFFPSAAVGWVLSNEPYMQFLKPAVDVLKIRASYGSLGNQQVSPFSYISTMEKKQLSGYLTNPNSPSKVDYVTVPELVAGDLTWETVTSANVGLDLDMFGRRLSIGLDAYQRMTYDMLASGVSLPSVLGATVPKTNSADLRVRGWEASVMWRDRFTLFGKPADYSAKFVMADNRAVITKYNANNGRLISGYNVGEEIGTIWGLECLGYFTSDEEAASWANQKKVSDNIVTPRAGDLKFKDQGVQDGKIDKGQETLDDPGDLIRIGNSSVRLPYSLDLTFAWNNFDLNIFFQGVGKRDFYPGAECAIFWGPYNRWYNPVWKHLEGNYWTEDNPDAYFPRLRAYMSNSTNNELGVPNTKYLQDASYLRLKTLTLGYTIPAKLTGKIGLSKVRMFFSGQNLLTFTKLYKCFDPEAINNLNNNGAGFVYPIQRTMTFGLDVNF